MTNRPGPDDAAPYYFTYIDKVPAGDIRATLKRQLDESLPLLSGIPGPKSLYRYAPDKWSIRQVVSHMSDTERVFLHRAFWFARGFTDALPGFDEKAAAAAAGADGVEWARHLDEFRSVRAATLEFFGNLPAEAWARRGVASGKTVTVNALAWIAAGHVAHHLGILKERYLAA